MSVSSGPVCRQFVDEPRCMVIIVEQKLTNDQAKELGRALGAEGFQGTFRSGQTADLLWKGCYGPKPHRKGRG